jgi:hypothetical protein
VLSSVLHDIKSTTETRLYAPAPTRKVESLRKLIRIKGKNMLSVSADQADIKRLQQKLDRAVEEFGVRNVI